MKIRFLKEWAVPLLVTLLFSIVTVSWIMLTVSYWTNTLEPRLRKEAQGYADLLVQSQASILVDILQKESNPTRIKAIMDSLVLGRDPVNNLPFFKGIELKDIMYDSVPSKRGSLDGLQSGFSECKDCFTSEVALQSSSTDGNDWESILSSQ